MLLFLMQLNLLSRCIHPTNLSYNEFIEYTSRYQQTLGVDESEKMVYCKNYARIRGAALHEDSFDSKVEDEKPLTASQMKELESRMTRHEIIAMRCAAMKNGTKVVILSMTFTRSCTF